MPYTTPTTRSTGNLITAANWNTDLVENIKFLANPPACRVYHNAAQSIPHNTPTILAFNSERFDTDTMHDTATNNSRITIKTAGLFHVQANVEWASAGGNSTRLVTLLLNGATTIGQAQIDGATGTQAMLVSSLYKFAVNDYIQVRVYHFQGGAVNLNSAGAYSPEFSAVWVGLG